MSLAHQFPGGYDLRGGGSAWGGNFPHANGWQNAAADVMLARQRFQGRADTMASMMPGGVHGPRMAMPGGNLPPMLAHALQQNMAMSGGGFGDPGYSQYGAPMMGQTGTTTVNDMLQQKVYTDIMTGAILTVGPLILYGLGAVVTNFQFRYAQSESGTTVYVPYWGVLPPVETIAVDGDRGKPNKLQSTDEQNTVRHGYFGAIETMMAQLYSPFGGMMPAEFQAQLRVRFAEWADKILLDEVVTKTTDGSLSTAETLKRRYDIYQASGSPPRKFRRQEYIKGITQRAQASGNAMGQSEKPVLLIVHVDTLGDMMLVNNAIGDMNLVKGADDPTQPMQISVTSASPTGLMMVPFNVPIAVTASASFKPTVADGQPAKYVSVAVYEKSLAWQQNPQMMVLEYVDIHIPSREFAGHSWAVGHLYKRHNMIDLPGAFAWIHN